MKLKFPPPKLSNLLIGFIAGILIFSSCRKQIETLPQPSEPIFASTYKQNVITDKQKEKVAVIKDVSSILKEIYKDQKVVYEVVSVIRTGYYEDETVLLKDLLYPDYSPLYKSEKFKASKSEKGIFKSTFLKELNKNDYAHLKNALGNASNTRQNARQSNELPTDTAMEIFSNSQGVSIYFPYSENFGANFTPAYFDNINTDPFGNLATVIPADREADAAPGNEPYRYKTYDQNGEIVWEIRYRAVTVNDDYAEVNPTHIVGVGAEPLMPQTPPPPPGTPINRVYHGWSRLNTPSQLDKLISFTGNGGGSEMKVARISGYLKFENQQVTNFAGDVMSIYYKRKEVRKRYWKRVYGVWDPDWKTDNTEQVYAAWEEDTEGTSTFTGEIKTAVRPLFDSTITISGTLGYSITVKTQDQLKTQRKQDRYSYFRDAKNEQGWGFQMCHPGWCGYDDTFLPSGQYWPKFDEGTEWGYTWPYRTF